MAIVTGDSRRIAMQVKNTLLHLGGICSIVFILIIPGSARTNTTVTIDSGTIEGSVSDDVLSFKGIPFAAPPVNQYRWRAPQPARPWTGVRQAVAFGHDCMQKPEPDNPTPSRATFSEDCLVLNVWRPAQSEPRQTLPVLIWIHGGGYQMGGSSPAIFDGSAFAKLGVILVSFNYRLGRFGFFAHPALIEASEGLVGNFAYMDQIEALRWVKRNIGAFGGNPTQVTVMGESAGGSSVLALLISPKARGLFQRAIMLSGGGRTFRPSGRKLTGGTPTDPSADQIGTNFAKNVGIDGNGAQTLNALRAVPAEEILGEISPSTYAGGPIIDRNIVIADPQIMFQHGANARVPIILGSTTQELAVIFPPSSENPLSYFGANAAKARALYNPDGKLDPSQVRSEIGAVMTMHEPARFIANQMTQAGMPVWLYRFDYVAESTRSKQSGALHASELPFLFDTLESRYGEAVTDNDRMIAGAFINYVANFVETGQPNGRGLPTWPKFMRSQPELMMFADHGLIAEADPWKLRLDLVERAVNAHLQ